MASASIIVCTHDNLQSLLRTVASLDGASKPAGLDVEVLIVDNACADGTSEALRSTQMHGKCFRLLSQPRKGKSRALNLALREAQGDVILFTDDDVAVPNDWIEVMSQPLLNRQADALVGYISLADYARIADASHPFAELLVWNEHKDPAASWNLIGANMSIGRWVFDKIPEFDPALGPGALGCHEDMLFSQQMRAAGFRIVAQPESRVFHAPDPKRLESQRLLRMAHMQGQGHGYTAHHWFHKKVNLLPLKRAVRRLDTTFFRRIRELKGGKVPTPREISLARNLGFFDCYAQEQTKLRRYEPMGLKCVVSD